jgi:GT2 family glycosyltransferase
VAFRRAAWEQVQGYPEWLDYCEDLVFDFALRNAGCHFEFHPEARVFFRPRHALGKFFRQYFLYARGDGKAGLWFKRHLVRYATYLGAIPLSLALFPFAPALSVVMWLLGCYALFGRPYRRLFNLWEPLSTLDKLSALMWVPVIRISGDMAKMLGYPFGILWRIRHGRMT